MPLSCHLRPFRPIVRKQLLSRLERILATLNDGARISHDMRAPYVRVTLKTLDRIETRLQRFKEVTCGAATLHADNRTTFDKDLTAAQEALCQLSNLAAGQSNGPVRKDRRGSRRHGLYFLKNVALMSWHPEQMR